MSPAFVRTVVLAAVAGALVVGLVATHDMASRVGKPFPAVLVYENGLAAPHLVVPARHARPAKPLLPHDRIVAIDGVPLTSGRDLWAAADRAGAGAELHAEIQRGKRRIPIDVPVDLFTERDFATLVLPFLLCALAMIVVGIAPVLVHPGLTTARVLATFSIAASIGFGFVLFDYYYAYRFQPWSLAATALAKASFLHLALLFPKRRWPLTRFPRAIPALLYPGLALQSVAYTWFMRHDPARTLPFAIATIATFALGALVLAFNIGETALREPDARLRQQARVMLPSPVLGLAGGALFFAWSMRWIEGAVPPAIYLIPNWFYVLSCSYAVLEHNLFEFDATVRRGIALGAVLAGVALAYLALLAGLEAVLGAGPAWVSAAAAALIAAVLVPGFEPVRARAERVVEETLFPGRRAARLRLREAARALARVRDAAGVATLLGDAMRESFGPSRVQILAGAPGESLRDLLGSASPREPAPAVVAALAGGAASHGETLLVPFPQGDAGSGAFVLGPRRDGRLYTREDAEAVEALAAPTATALANARAWDALHALRAKLAEENVFLRAELRQRAGFEEVIGTSPALREVLAQIERVAPTDAAVLLLGETGTGKEVLVRALHRLSRRADRALVKVACAAIPESLLESEFFGHERGAFTGAGARRIGRFEVADGGTLFFDDVDTLPLPLQAKLLRALQEGEVQRLGSNAVRRVDVRVVAATNRDLAAEVQAGHFRQDLYYRLAVVPLRVPPLRERREDVPLLVQHFLERECEKQGRPPRPIAQSSLAALSAHAWPGNVRELRNTVQRAVVLSSGDVIQLAEALEPAAPGARVAPLPSGALLDDRGFAEIVRSYKVAWIEAALAEADGHQGRAAAALGLHRQSLARMLRELGIAQPNTAKRAAGSR